MIAPIQVHFIGGPAADEILELRGISADITYEDREGVEHNYRVLHVAVAARIATYGWRGPREPDPPCELGEKKLPKRPA